MPGMIGASAPTARFDPSQMSGADKMMMFGAMLHDTGNSLRGGDGDAVLATRNLLAQRQMYQNSLGMIRGLMGAQPTYNPGPDPSVSAPSVADAANPSSAPAPTSLDDLTGALRQSAASVAPPPAAAAAAPYTYQPPTLAPGTGPLTSINDPRAAQLALAGPMLGIDPKPLIDVLKATQPQFDTARPGTQVINKLTGALGAKVSNPEYVNGRLVDPTAPDAPGYVPNHQVVNGFNIDPNGPGAPSFVPQLPAGTIPDGKGGVIPMGGAVAAVQAAAQAEAMGRSMGTYQTVPNLDGSSSLMLGKDVPQVGAPAAAAPTGPTPASPAAGAVPTARPGTSQSPADAEYKKGLSAAAAENYNALQKAGAAAPGTIARIQAMGNLLKGYEGGKYAPQALDMLSAANSLGVHIMGNTQTNAQAAKALQAQMTMELMKNPDTGANMFPRVTNFEMQQFTNAVPGLGQNAAGRDRLVQAYTALQQRGADVAQQAYKWNQLYGRIDAPDANGQSFQQRLNGWIAKHPVYAGIPGFDPKASPK